MTPNTTPAAYAAAITAAAAARTAARVAAVDAAEAMELAGIERDAAERVYNATLKAYGEHAAATRYALSDYADAICAAAATREAYAVAVADRTVAERAAVAVNTADVFATITRAGYAIARFIARNS